MYLGWVITAINYNVLQQPCQLSTVIMHHVVPTVLDLKLYCTLLQLFILLHIGIVTTPAKMSLVHHQYIGT